jgi:hypothetical protein
LTTPIPAKTRIDATAMRGVNGSFNTSTPSSTAITGLT